MTETRLRPEGGNRTRLTGPARIEGCPFSGASSSFLFKEQETATPKCSSSFWSRKFRIQDSKLLLGLQPAEGAHEADLRDASCGPPPPGGCGPPMPAASNLEASPQPSRGVRDVEDAALRPGTAAGCCAPKDAIKNSIFKITNSGCSLRSARKFGYELRASATPRLRPADASGIENPPESPQRRSLPKEKDRRCNTRSVS